MDLTVQNIHDFVNAINLGREAIGEPATSLIEFDASEPESGENCLSARHLFVRGESDFVGPTNAYTDNADVLQLVFGTSGGDRSLRIPEEILKVTAVFDAGAEDGELLSELRALFVEAGYIEP